MKKILMAACLPILAVFISNRVYSAEKYEFKIPVEMAQSGEPKADSEAWRQFFLSSKKYHRGLLYTYVSFYGIETKALWEAERPMWSVSVFNTSLPDSEFPQSTIGLSKVGDFGLSGNELTNVNFMKGVKEATRNLYFNNNKISSLKGFSDLVKQADMFDLKGNKFTSLDGLQNLRSIRTLAIYNNPQLVDLSAIENLGGYGLVALDELSQYKIKPRKGSVFCNSIRDKKIYAKVRKDSPKGNYIDSPFLTVDQVCM
jgi:hypothetical protein